MKKTALVAVVCLLASTAMASEVVSFTAVPSQGGPGLASVQAMVTGGFSMGALDWSGIATPINTATWGSELTVDISGPLGAATLGLGTGTTYTPGTAFSGTSNAYLGAGDPAGMWTFDFYESFDDGGDLLPDATWDSIDFTFNDAGPGLNYTVYDNLADFQAMLCPNTTPLTEDFAAYTYGSYTQPTLTLGPNPDGYEAVLSAAGGLYSGNGDMSTNSAGDALVIDLTGTPVTALAGDFYGGDISGNPIQADITLTLQDGSTVVFSTNGPQFRGFVADQPITTLSIDANGGVANAWPTVDNLIVGCGIPEPASIMLIALAGLFIRRR